MTTASTRSPPSIGEGTQDDHELAVIGKRVPKVDVWGKVTGETRYTDDLQLPRMAFGKLLRSLQFVDVEAAFAKADLVLEDVFFYQGNNLLAMEQHAALASWGPDGKLTLWSSTQTPH